MKHTVVKKTHKYAPRVWLAYLRYCIILTTRHYKDIDLDRSIGIFPRNRSCHRWERRKPFTQKKPTCPFPPLENQRGEP